MKLPWYKYYLALIDFLIILISFFETRWLLLILGNGIPVQQNTSIFGISVIFIVVSFLFSFFLVFLFQNFNLYKINVFLSKSSQITNIVRSLIYFVIILILFSFVIKFSYVVESRLLVLALFFVSLINFIFFRVFIFRLLFIKYSTHKPLGRNIAIIGAGIGGKMLAAKLAFEDVCGHKLIGYIDDKYKEGQHIISGFYNLGTSKDIKSIKEKYALDEVIIAIDHISYSKLLELIDKCKETDLLVKLNSNLFDIVPQKFQTESFLDIPLVELRVKTNNKINLVFKKIFDSVVTLIGLILLIPLFLVIALLIKISSKGPIIYKQVRIGKEGKPFMFYKFRSMYVSNVEDIERKESMINFMKNNIKNNSEGTKVINEKRVTWIGKFLRKTSLDELPQLFNVLKGEMSLVGPRPCLPYEYDNYEEWQKRRLSVTPGCTGVWQVAGRSNVSFNDSVVLDLYYINNMSPWLDLQLIIKTIPVMLFGRGGK